MVGRNADDLEVIANDMRALGVGACHFAGDVCEYATADQAVSECRAHLGAVSHLINNAGVNTGDGAVCTVDPESWWRTLEVNLKGPFNFLRAVLPDMVLAGVAALSAWGRIPQIRRCRSIRPSPLQRPRCCALPIVSPPKCRAMVFRCCHQPWLGVERHDLPRRQPDVRQHSRF